MLWEILVPTVINGKPIRTRYHRVWDHKVHDIAGGMTILRPVKGAWISPTNEKHEERMIPVRIMCDEKTIKEIALYTLDYYKQEAVMYYLISEKSVILKRK